MTFIRAQTAHPLDRRTGLTAGSAVPPAQLHRDLTGARDQGLPAFSDGLATIQQSISESRRRVVKGRPTGDHEEMRLTYDEEVGAAYLRLRFEADDVRTVTSQPISPPGSVHADDEVVLDFDREGHLVGIEFLTAERRLLPSVLATANRQRR